MYTLKNDRIEIQVDEIGAEIRRITFDGNDILWNGDAKFWTGTAPVLFPICGGLRDDKYTLDGKEYTLLKHGFARLLEFSVEKSGCNFVTFLLTDSPETLKQYPWHFELRITYRLRGSAIEVDYDVKNTSDSLMYFSIGAHEAYACPEGIEDYDIIFPQKETLDTCVLDGNLIDHSFKTVLKDSDTLALYTKYFENDALVFKSVKSRSVTLRNRKTGRSLTVDFPGFDYLLFWTKPGAGYICIEPWCGIPGMVDDGYAIEEKEGIEKLDAGCSFHRRHTIYL